MSNNEFRNTVLAVISRFVGQTNTLTVSVPLIDATGSIKAALLLSQLIYWTDRSTIAGGWVAKTYDSWYDEIRLSKDEARAAIHALRAAGVETKLAKWNGAPTVHYRINREVFSEWIAQKLGDEPLSDYVKTPNGLLKNPTMDYRKTRQSIVGKSDNPLTETTAETTQRLHTSTRKRDVVFDAIALHIFGIEGNVPKSSGGRIAKVKKALVEIECCEVPTAAARVAEFVRWYKSYHPGVSIPRDAGKVAEYYLAYKAWADERDVKSSPVVAHEPSEPFEVPPIFADLDLSEPTSLEDQQVKVQAVLDRIAAKWSQN